MKRVKYLPVALGDAHNIENLPNFSSSGSARGMRERYPAYKTALLVKCGSFIYNVTSQPKLYDLAH